MPPGLSHAAIGALELIEFVTPPYNVSRSIPRFRGTLVSSRQSAESELGTELQNRSRADPRRLG